MERIDVVILKEIQGSEDGIIVQTFQPGPAAIEKKLAAVFIEHGWAKLPDKGKPGPVEKKVVTPEVKKVVVPEEVKKKD